MPFSGIDADVGSGPFLICLLTEGNLPVNDSRILSVGATVEPCRDKACCVLLDHVGPSFEKPKQAALKIL